MTSKKTISFGESGNWSGLSVVWNRASSAEWRNFQGAAGARPGIDAVDCPSVAGIGSASATLAGRKLTVSGHLTNWLHRNRGPSQYGDS